MDRALRDRLYAYFQRYPCIGTDTRKDLTGCIFWALKGERYDANRFVEKAFEAGAEAVVTNHPAWKSHERVFYVEGDTLEALHDFARFHRRRMPAKVIAVTGSNGKTTTKELMASVLRQKYRVVATEGNLNNHFGVPLMLLRIRPDTEVAVIEMGTNHPGEIAMLAAIAEPDYGYITSFGEAHLEFFGDLDGVIREKTALYRYLKQNDGTAFVHYDDPVQEGHTRGMNRYGFSFGPYPRAELHFRPLDRNDKASLVWDGLEIRSNLTGRFHLPNIGAAVTVGHYFGVAPAMIRQGIEAYVPRNNRSQLIKRGNLTILLDAYNANPTSMRAAIENLARYEGPKWAVLGDMLELGPKAAAKHQEIVDLLARKKIPAYLIGEHFGRTKPHAHILGRFAATDDFIRSGLFDGLNQGTVLIKGSRGLRLERILEK